MSNKIDLGGRNAVITGGAQGIGRAIVERFLDSGAAVAIWDRDTQLAQKTAKELEKRGKAIVVSVDVTNYKDVERARDETVKAFGRIDILVNNAGIAGPNTTTWDYPLDAWRQVMSCPSGLARGVVTTPPPARGAAGSGPGPGAAARAGFLR